MDILFHVEPLIEMGRPFWKIGWANEFAAMLMRSLRSADGGGPHRFCLAVSEPIAERLLTDDDVRVAVFAQRELVADFSGSALEASLAWYRGDATEAQEVAAAAAVRRKLGDFSPDVVVAFSPAPYLRRAFPRALVLHMEYSLLSRPPYPATWYLDPAGMLASSFLHRFGGQLSARQVDTERRALLESFRDRCRSLLLAASPFREILADERGRFEHLVLLPLQFSGYYGFDGNVAFRSQFEYLAAVLDGVDPSVGVVVTTHPEYPTLDLDAVRYLEGRYPHFIYREEFEDYYAAAQFILPEVDGVITVSSSLGLQALLHGRRLITLGRCHHPALSDAAGLSGLPGMLRARPPDREPLLCWMLTHYAIPERFLRDAAWLDAFLRRSLERVRAVGIDADFYRPIAPAGEVFAALLEGIDPEIPKARPVAPAHVVMRRQEARIEELTERLGAERALRERAEDGWAASAAANARLTASRSWKITRPLRALGRVAGRFRRSGPSSGGEV